MEEIEELLTLRQTAELLKVHPATLRRWDREGKLKALRIGSRRGIGDRRYKKIEVLKYLKTLNKK